MLDPLEEGPENANENIAASNNHFVLPSISRVKNLGQTGLRGSSLIRVASAVVAGIEDPLSTWLLHLRVAPCLGSLIIDAALGWECRWGY